MESFKVILKNITDKLKIKYPNSSIGLLGCQTSNNYPQCEYDFLIISEGINKFERCIISGNFVDIIIIDREKILENGFNNLGLALINLRILSDPQWILAQLSHNAKHNALKHYYNYSKKEIFNSITAMSRFEDSLKVGNISDAAFWLTGSCYKFSRSLISYNEIVPKPSHLLYDFRKISFSNEIFESWADILNLKLATGISVYRRLEAIKNVFHELSKISSDFKLNERITYRLYENRVNVLLDNHSTVDAFSFLGNELNEYIQKLYEIKCEFDNTSPSYHSMISDLVNTESQGIGLSKQTIRMIDFNLEKKALKKQATVLKKFLFMYGKRISRKKLLK